MSLHSLLPQHGNLTMGSILNKGIETLDASERIYGVVPARVFAIDDQKNQRHMQAHVQIWFPWLQQEDDKALFKPWARVAVPDAGNEDKTGFKMTPNHARLDGGEPFKVGDEVLVAFEHGDPHVPYVLGALWNKLHNIPEPITPADGNDCACNNGGPKLKTPSYKPNSLSGGSGKNKVMYVKSRSGNLLVMDDEEGTIRLNDATGNSVIQLEKDTILMLQRKGDIAVWAKKTISFTCETYQIHARGRIFYKADKNISLSAKGKVTNMVGGKLYKCPKHPKNQSGTQDTCKWPVKGGGQGAYGRSSCAPTQPCNTKFVLAKNGGETKGKAGENISITSKKTVEVRSDKDFSMTAMKSITISSATKNLKLDAKGKFTMVAAKPISFLSQTMKLNFDAEQGIVIASPMDVKFSAGSQFVATAATINLN